MRNRDSNKPESVIQRYIEILGYKRIMHICDVSRTTVYAYANEGAKPFPSIDTLLKLDAASLASAGTAPFGDWYQHCLNNMDAPEEEGACIRSASMDLTVATGKLTEAIQEALDEESEGGSDISPQEGREIDERLKRLTEEANALKQIVDSRVRKHNRPLTARETIEQTIASRDVTSVNFRRERG